MAQTIHLADTNVVSEFVKKAPNPKVMNWLKTAGLLALSAITIEEANFGLAWQPNANKLKLFNAMAQGMHAIYPVTESIAQRAGILRGQLQAQGIIRSTPDMLIAATAQEHQLIIATRNVKDFLGCGVQVINPFEHTA